MKEKRSKKIDGREKKRFFWFVSIKMNENVLIWWWLGSGEEKKDDWELWRLK